MGRSRRLKKRNLLRKDKVLPKEKVLEDPQMLRDMIGTALYDRVMEWNDSGAAEALQIAETRRKAMEIKKPCWVPKLNDELYLCHVDWNIKESGEACTMPVSAVASADEAHNEPCSSSLPPLNTESKEVNESASITGSHNQSPDTRAVLGASINAPLMVDAVLEQSADGVRLVVDGLPVEPSGWDDADFRAPDEPFLVEAVLEDFGDGQRLLVGGLPVQPSWDEADSDWSQLRWPGHNVESHNQVWTDYSSRHICISDKQSRWHNSCYHNNNGSKNVYQGHHFMTAF
ncbi:hypothetical protein KP509_26G023900 [Ceratopteris richardii]|uniref:Uncharacterized protein n=1 Tax=Ceratopteris richardii TaxID=49495 RepID=A0A8T2RKI8_CERRI|nr:hypothetical protein KP509_26G023900 [Ceratopteris richardii]